MILLIRKIYRLLKFLIIKNDFHNHAQLISGYCIFLSVIILYFRRLISTCLLLQYNVLQKYQSFLCRLNWQSIFIQKLFLTKLFFVLFFCSFFVTENTIFSFPLFGSARLLKQNHFVILFNSFFSSFVRQMN